MKNTNESPFKVSTELLNLTALVLVVVNVISERVGTYPSYGSGRFSKSELLGIVIPLMILVIPIFAKNYRENLWGRKSIIISIVILIISIVLIVVMYANKDFYRVLWIESHWTRDNCPPIRWDFWNIIGKSAY